jgi:hypothetical protein
MESRDKKMIEGREIRRISRQAMSRPGIIPVLIGLTVSGLIGLAVVWIARQLPDFDLPETMILAIPVVGLMMLLIGMLKYDWLVLATFCLIGFVRFEPAPFDLLLVLLLVIGLVTGQLNPPDIKSRPLVWLGLWGLIVANLLSLLANGVTSASLRFLGITLYVLVLFVFVRMFAVRPQAMRWLLIGYSVAAVLNALPVVLGFFGLYLPFSVVAWSTRGVGFFKDANVFGPFMVIGAFWLVDWVIHQRKQRPQSALWLAVALLLGIGAMLSLSRGAWINMFLCGCLYLTFLLRHTPRKGLFLLTFAVLLIMASLVVFQSLGLNEVIVAHSHLQDYDRLRFNIQREGLITGFTSPLGVGPAGWPNAHSLYVKTFAEQGFLGVAALSILIGGLVFPLLRQAMNEGGKTDGITGGVLLALIAGQLVNSLVIDSMHWRHFWVVLGLAWAYLDMQAEIEEEDTAPDIEKRAGFLEFQP